MISLIIHACLINDPGVCKDHAIPVLASTTPSSCALHAPPHFAKWSGENPQWAIKRWRCGAPGSDVK
ncbi:MAG: hypothetical protein AAFV69_03790 [Pseudomonadota bacterium]